MASARDNFLRCSDVEVPAETTEEKNKKMKIKEKNRII